MEEFSQSRGDDDLFDDEIVPIEPSEQETSVPIPVQHISLQSTQPAAPAPARNNEPSRGPRGRGRGTFARGSAKRNDLSSSKYAPQPKSEPTTQEKEEKAEPTEVTLEQAEVASETSATDPSVAKPSSAAVPAPTSSRPVAVRGDRTNTGGVKKPKLTEEELTQKLAAAKERSQNLSAAHARAQADAASFEERERVAQQKRAKDAVNRKVMDNERERNRERKMKALGVREWDAEKKEEDFRTTGRGGRGRGGQMRATYGTTGVDRGDPSQDDLRQYEWHEDRGRGRGGRGRGRGEVRGGRLKQPNVTAETEFPALPAAAKSITKDSILPRPATEKAAPDVLSPVEAGSSWADESSEAAKA